MKKIDYNISLASVTKVLRRVTSDNASSTLLWRILLGCGLTLAVALGVIAWLVYGWVTKAPIILPPSKAKQATLSIEELHEVIALYQKKDEEHAVLLQFPPDAPALEVGSGVIDIQ
jgi:hypothetical protein